jgi:hypothetical protein
MIYQLYAIIAIAVSIIIFEMKRNKKNDLIVFLLSLLACLRS